MQLDKDGREAGFRYSFALLLESVTYRLDFALQA